MKREMGLRVVLSSAGIGLFALLYLTLHAAPQPTEQAVEPTATSGAPPSSLAAAAEPTEPPPRAPVEAPREAWLTVWVKDGAGVAAPGVTVLCSLSSESNVWANDPAVAVADSQGRADFHGLQEGRASVTTNLGGNPDPTPIRFGHHETVVVQLGAMDTITGKVLDADGQGCAAAVEASVPNHDWRFVAITRSNEHGDFRIRLPVGESLFVRAAGDDGTLSRTRPVHRPSDPPLLVLRLRPMAVTQRFRILDGATGQPLPDAEIGVGDQRLGIMPQADGSESVTPALRLQRTEEHGTADFADAESFPQPFFVRKDGFETTTGTLNWGHGDLVIRLARSPTVIGTVWRDGQPQVRAMVFWGDGWAREAVSVATDAAGRYEMRGLPVGAPLIHVRTADGKAFAVARVATVAGATTRWDPILESAASSTLTLLQSTGQPLAEADVVLSDTYDGRTKTTHHRWHEGHPLTIPAGSFDRLSVYAPAPGSEGVWTRWPLLTLSANEVRPILGGSLVVDVRPWGRLRGATGGRVTIVQTDSGTRTDVNAAAAWDIAVPPGGYDVTVGDDTAHVEVAAGTPVDVAF